MKQAFLVLCFCLLTSDKAFCQFYTGPDMDFMVMQHSTYMSNFNLINSNTEYYNEERRRNQIKSEGTELRGSSVSKTTSTKPVNPQSFLFIPNSETSVQVKEAIIANIKKKNPDSKLGEALNEKNNPYPNYVQLLQTLGLDIQHNYADAFTAYLLGMWRIANKMNANPTTEQIRAVRKQVVATTSVSQMNNTQKQQAVEYMIYDLIFANEPYEGSRKAGNKKQLQKDADAVYNRFLKQNRLNFRKMEIREAGLVTVR